jgi:hypothetical protein
MSPRNLTVMSYTPPQGLLAVTKWILAYGNFEKEDTDVNRAIIGVLYAGLIASSFLGRVSKEELPCEMVRNAQFNVREDYAGGLVRVLYICTDLAQKKEYYGDAEWVDFNADFQKHYGYTILEYVSMMCGLFTVFYNQDRKIVPDSFVNAEEVLGRTGFKEKAGLIIKDMTTTLEEARKNALKSLDEDWNFSSFLAKPLLTLDGVNVIPIFHGVLYSKFFISLKIKIENCYKGKKAEDFRAFWGKPFEKYVELLMQKSCEHIAPAQVHGEFEYCGKKSPDVMLCFENSNNTLVVEAKAMYMRSKSVFFQKDEAVKREIYRLIVKPLRQSHDRIEELIAPNSPRKIGKRGIYLVTVNMSGLVTNSLIDPHLNKLLERKFRIPIKAYLYLSIEEYEMLCSLIEKPPKGKSIFGILDGVVGSGVSFRDYFANLNKLRKYTRPRLMVEVHEEMFKRISDTIKIKEDISSPKAEKFN